MTTHTGHTEAIPASKVMGTPVYNTAGDHIGTIEDVMLDKTSNGIMFAVIGFGGFLGIGEKYHAIPWSVLDYQRSQERLRGALQQGPARGGARLFDPGADQGRRTQAAPGILRLLPGAARLVSFSTGRRLCPGDRPGHFFVRRTAPDCVFRAVRYEVREPAASARDP
jgi:sporulation protein YlmC with PRC-barrel domain